MTFDGLLDIHLVQREDLKLIEAAACVPRLPIRLEILTRTNERVRP
jgi:hypothetical protein